MKKAVLKGIVSFMTFLISLIIIGNIMNKGNNNMTMEMAPATLPVITMEKEGIAYNQLHGYRQAMEVSFQRQNITELGSNREAEFTINTYGGTVTGISAELRSVDGERLIENTSITEYEQENGIIRTRVALKDLIEADTEYNLTILLHTEEAGDIRYYTKVIWSENTAATEKLQFVKNFHETLYDKEASRDLVKYLESNSLGDNSTFHKVNIHSSFHMITWGDLEVTQIGEPNIQMTELASQTASFLVNFVVHTFDETGNTYYQVVEFYRIRYTTDRIYLLDYERTMTQIPDMEEDMYENDKILLGVVSEDIPFVESEDGNIIVFVAANRLCSYNLSTNKLAVVFSFYDNQNKDERTLYSQHEIKILDVDEGGNIRFAVYGYMNRGRHEGEVGIQICYYDSTLNTVEEAVYMPYTKSYAVLLSEMEQLLYMNRENVLYVYLENSIYGVNLNEKTYEIIAKISQDDSMQVSANHKILVWQEGEDIYHSTRLMVKNLSSGTERTIEAGSGEVLLPLGFMDEDIIYGVARQEDIVKENTGRIFYPMYKVCIRNSEGSLLKEYRMDRKDIYVTGCRVESNQITMDRVMRREDGTFVEASEDQIMYNVETQQGKNALAIVTTDTYGKYVQIQVRNTIDRKTLKILTPKEVLFEGGRELSLITENEAPRFYVYGAYGMEGIYNSPANAINLAYSLSGVVNNAQGDCVWLKGNRVLRNQIMAIGASGIEEGETSLAVCLDTILKFEGIVRNSQYLLEQGQTVVKILEDSLDNVQVMELTGCSLDAVLYYVNQDIPVLAILENGEAVLITGFNEFNVVIMEPDSQGGKLYKKGMNDSAEWFLENGNRFITYIRNQ